MSGQAGGRRDMWGMAATWLRGVGFLLLFVGTIVAVWFGTVNGGCLSGTNCGPTSPFAQGQHNGIWAANFLWTFGLAMIGAGAGVKLHWGLKEPTSGRPEDYRWVSLERVMNYVLFFVVAILLFFLLSTYLPLAIL